MFEDHSKYSTFSRASPCSCFIQKSYKRETKLHQAQKSLYVYSRDHLLHRDKYKDYMMINEKRRAIIEDDD